MDGNGTQQVRRTAALAKLDLEEGEAAVLGPQFDAILEHFRVLSELDVEGEEPMTSPLAPGDLSRADEPRASTPRDQLLEGAPDPRQGFYGVPKTVGGGQTIGGER